MNRRWPRGVAPLVLLAGLLGSAVGVCPARGAGAPTADERLSALAESARGRYRAAAASEPGFSMITLTESGDAEPLAGRFSVRGGATRTETWFEGLFSNYGFVSVTNGPRTWLWRVSGHVVERGDRAVNSGAEVFVRWFEHPAVVHGEAWISGDEVIDERTCHVIRLATTQVAGRHAHRFPGGSAEEIDALLAETGLRMLLVQALVDGEARALDPQEWAARKADSSSPTATELWAVEDLVEPAIAGRSPRGGVVPVLALRKPLDVITRMWVDTQSLQLVQLEGYRRDEQTGESRPVVVTLSGFLKREWSWPTAVQVAVSGEIVQRVEVVEVVDEPPSAATFEPSAVTAELELGVQAANEAEIRELMTNTTFKHGGLDPARDLVFKPDLLVDTLELADGDVVADIGAGTGYFTFHLARAVGPSGHVIAVDVNANVLEALQARMNGEGVEAVGAGKNVGRKDILAFDEPAAEGTAVDLCPFRNVEIHVNDFDDLMLPNGSLDVAFLCASGLSRYSHLAPTNRRMMESIYRACRPGGEFVVLERQPQGRNLPFEILGLASVPAGPAGMEGPPPGVAESYPFGLDEIIRANGLAAGFEVVRSVDLVEAHAFVIFRKPVD